ncbi:Lipid A core - O-antigen ligase and related enzymes [Bacillus freudenreichii]|nr:Lipid A core - O-antigen ligase and related enzymes [Bacillus freudenreichii]
MNLPVKIYDNEFFLAIISCISIISITISHGIPFMPIIFFIYLLVYLKQKKINLKVNIYYFLFYIMVFLYLWGMLFNKGIIYQNNKTDLMNVVYCILIILCASFMNLLKFKQYMYVLFKLLSFTIPVIALISIYKFYLLSNGIQLNFLIQGRENYPLGTSLVTDYNMFALGLSIGFVSLVYFYKIAQSLILKLLLMGGITLVGISIYLSGSRRGIIVLAFLLIYLFIIIVRSNNRGIAKNRQRLKTFALFTIFGFVFFMLFSTDLKVYETEEFERIELRSSSILEFKDSFSGRADRWDYGVELLKESSLLKLFLGDGFQYLEKFQERFATSSEDYPHNFLLAAFLYSGLIGMLIILTLLCLLLIRLFKYRKVIGIEMLIVFSLMLVFLISSGNSIFSIRILPIFILIISAVKTNEKMSIDQPITNMI